MTAELLESLRLARKEAPSVEFRCSSGGGGGWSKLSLIEESSKVFWLRVFAEELSEYSWLPALGCFLAVMRGVVSLFWA